MSSNDDSFVLALGECEKSFNLEKAVCNHGFFMMPPNRWLPQTKTLQRPLRIAHHTHSLLVSISHPLPPYLLIIPHNPPTMLTCEDRQTIIVSN